MKIKKIALIFSLILICVFASRLCIQKVQAPNFSKQPQKASLINPDGTTVETRINPPEQFTREPAEEGSLAGFLRSYPVKADKSPVLLYNGEEKSNQSAHAAVLMLPIENENLQQCADSVMRIYAEYFWSAQKYDKIAFHLTDGFLAEYSKWRQGYRIKISENRSKWVKSADADNSYECFKKYLRIVFSYAGTLSMESESKEIPLDEIQIGDVFLRGGSPGHVAMVVDICRNEQGEKAFLLGQGYMPAQEFHILKNPLHANDPWYYETEFLYPLKTPEYTFGEGSLRRLCYAEGL